MMNGLQRRDDFMNNMLSWFDDSFAPFTNHESGEMRTDITEDDHKYQVTVDLPGFSKKDLHLNYAQNILTVSGRRETVADQADHEGNLLHSERRYGQFSRQYRLPNVDQAGINAKYENGVLTITLPKLTATDKAGAEIEID